MCSFKLKERWYFKVLLLHSIVVIFSCTFPERTCFAFYHTKHFGFLKISFLELYILKNAFLKIIWKIYSYLKTTAKGRKRKHMQRSLICSPGEWWTLVSWRLGTKALWTAEWGHDEDQILLEKHCSRALHSAFHFAGNLPSVKFS